MSSEDGTDWREIARVSAIPSGENALSAADRDALEQRVVVDSNDADARVRLAGYCSSQSGPADQQRQTEQLVWLATHRPDIGLGGFGTLSRVHPGYEAVRRAWAAAVTRPDASASVLENAASFLAVELPEEEESLLRRALAMRPGDVAIHLRIAASLTRRAKFEEDVARRHRLARTAIDELAIAHGLEPDDWARLAIRIEIVKAAISAEDWELVRATSALVVTDDATCTDDLHHGDAIHWANIGFGRAALAAGRTGEAIEHLLRAGRAPSSDELTWEGPDRELARALLRCGEQAAVVTFLTDCATFWEDGADHLETWRTKIERGIPTRLDEYED